MSPKFLLGEALGYYNYYSKQSTGTRIPVTKTRPVSELAICQGPGVTDPKYDAYETLAHVLVCFVGFSIRQGADLTFLLCLRSCEMRSSEEL